MSDPLYIDAGIGETVGTATIATDGTFTITAHGQLDGQPVRVDTLTGGAAGVFREGVTYYVRDATANTFALESIPGDETITLGSAGGADVHTAAPHYTAIERRQHDAGLLFGGTADRFGARQGIHPSTDPPVTLSGTTWTVEDITGVVYPGITTESGPYRFAHTSESGSLNPADGTLDRVDALDLVIEDDDEDSSGFRRARVEYVVGTPGAGLPAVTPNALRLTRGGILVPAGGTPAPSITPPLAVFTVASGGVLPVRDASERPTAGRTDGMIVWRQDRRGLEVWNPGTMSWDVVGQRIATTVRTVNSNTTTTTEIVIDTVIAPVVSGRVYKVTWHGRPHTSVSGDSLFLFLREDSVTGSVGQNLVFNIPISFRGPRMTLEFEYTADVTENKTFVAGLDRSSGTGNASGLASSSDPTYLYVDLVR